MEEDAAAAAGAEDAGQDVAVIANAFADMNDLQNEDFVYSL
jgi:hypothetical protein